MRGVTEVQVIDPAMIHSPEALRLNAMAAELHDIYGAPARYVYRDKESRVDSPIGLIETVLEIGRRGLSLQRYKGLGEMNPDQLWETTLDPNVRALLQVRVNHADEADEIFSTLMGDVVEPRREFIQTNALNVVHLDV